MLRHGILSKWKILALDSNLLANNSEIYGKTRTNLHFVKCLNGSKIVKTGAERNSEVL